MSQLWIQAVSTQDRNAEWYHQQPGDHGWDEYGHGQETLDERHSRWTKHIQDAHGVSADAARHGLHQVLKGLRLPEGALLPTEKMGLRPTPGYSRDISRYDWEDGLAPVQDVPLHAPLHSSQLGLEPRLLAHNLFHPGQMPPAKWRELGHPDAAVEHRESPDVYTGPTDLPRLLRHPDDTHEVWDGNHRLAVDILLGKPTSRARVLDLEHRW